MAAGVPADRVRVIHNGIDLDSLDRRSDSRGRQLPEPFLLEGPKVCCVGAFYPGKAQDVVIRALERLPKELQCHLIIIGDAAPSIPDHVAYGEELRRLARELQIEDRVHFLGWRDDVARLLRCADVLVVPSKWPEPFGMVCIEGMASGCAVVASTAGALPEIIDNGTTGLLVRPGDVDELASAIRELLVDGGATADMRVAGRQRVEASFTIERVAARTLEVYEQAMGSC